MDTDDGNFLIGKLSQLSVTTNVNSHPLSCDFLEISNKMFPFFPHVLNGCLQCARLSVCCFVQRETDHSPALEMHLVFEDPEIGVWTAST